MSAQDRAIQKLARELAGIKKEVVSWRGPQADYTSIENGGNFTFKDGDGNVTAVVGGQDDGSNTIRHVDGPTPPVPSGLSAHVDGPIVQVSWDGTFESSITHDWHYLEVLAVGPSNEQLTGTIDNADGGSTSLAATSQGDWVVVARSVSRAGKRSLDGDAGTVAVQLVGLTGAIEAVQESANGKSTIYYSPTEPTPPEAGFNNGDLWFDTSEEGNNTASVWDGNGWVSMEDARLATIIAAQEALESDLQDVQTSVDGKNKITYDPALPPASYVGVAGDTWYRTSGNSMIGFWKWDGAAWVQQELSTTVIPQIDIGAGTFGSLAGSRLQAASVTADKVLIGIGTDLIADGGFKSPIGAGWKIWGGTASVWKIEEVPNGTNYLTCTQGGSGWKEVYSNPPVAVTPGQQYLVSADFRKPEVWPESGPRIAVFTFDGAGSRIASWTIVRHTAASTDWTPLAGSFTVPSGTASIAFVVSVPSNAPAGVEVHVRNPVFRLKSGATLIENGAITTDKLAVGAITAESGIIESLDLGTATVGELDGIRIAAQTIRGQQLSGDAIDGKVITGGTYRTTGGTGSWSDDGLFIAQPDGTSMVRFPTDGSPLSLTASDVQIERASVGELDVVNETVRSGGNVTLASGVTPPTSPPELTTGWQKVCTLEPNDSNMVFDRLGLAYWGEGGGHWVRACNYLGSVGDSFDSIELFDSVTGEFERSISLDINPQHGVTVIGDVAYVLGRDHLASNVKDWVHGFDLNTGARVTRWEFTRFQGAPNRLSLAAAGGNLLVVGVTNTPLIYAMQYNPETGVQVGPDASGVWDVAYTRQLEGVALVGSTLYVVHEKNARTYTLSGSSLTKSFGLGWENPNKDASGFVWKDSDPHVVTGSGGLVAGSDFTNDPTVQVCYTWWDGTHETTPSGIASVAVASRRSVTVSLPKRAGLQKRLYMRQGTSGDWVRETVGHDATAHTVTWVSPLAPRHPLPTTNTFPNADPATLKSTNDKFEVKGDGSGRWGPLTFNADGTMTSSQIPSWVPLTTFKSGFGPQTFGFAPAYRVWPDGKVEWRGVIAGNIAGTTTIATIPTVARPAQYVELTAATGNPGGGRSMLSRIEFGPTAGDMVALPNGIIVDWISLEGCYYYLT